MNVNKVKEQLAEKLHSVYVPNDDNCFYTDKDLVAVDIILSELPCSAKHATQGKAEEQPKELRTKATHGNHICSVCSGYISKDEDVIVGVIHAGCHRKKQPESGEFTKYVREQALILINVKKRRPENLCDVSISWVLEVCDIIDHLNAELKRQAERIEELKKSKMTIKKVIFDDSEKPNKVLKIGYIDTTPNGLVICVSRP